MKKTKTKFETWMVDRFKHLLDDGWYDISCGSMGVNDSNHLLDLKENWSVDDEDDIIYDEYEED